MQTGEDNSERDVQTDEVTSSDRWVQWPPEDLKGFGGVCVCVCVGGWVGGCAAPAAEKCYHLSCIAMVAHINMYMY